MNITCKWKKPVRNCDSEGGFWLSDLDSNQDKSLQRALCYRYTIGQPAQTYAFGDSVQNVFRSSSQPAQAYQSENLSDLHRT